MAFEGMVLKTSALTDVRGQDVNKLCDTASSCHVLDVKRLRLTSIIPSPKSKKAVLGPDGLDDRDKASLQTTAV